MRNQSSREQWNEEHENFKQLFETDETFNQTLEKPNITVIKQCNNTNTWKTNNNNEPMKNISKTEQWKTKAEQIR